MSVDEKNKYKILADKLNSKRKETKQPEQISTLQNNSSDYWKMKDNLENMFELIVDNKGKSNLVYCLFKCICIL